jgi:hypothetical protein
VNSDFDNDQIGDDKFGHEQQLEQLVIGLLREADLEDLCEQAELPVLLDAVGVPVELIGVRSYHDAGVLTLDRGVWLEFSDGAVYGLTVSVACRPAQPGCVRPPRRQDPDPRR